MSIGWIAVIILFLIIILAIRAELGPTWIDQLRAFATSPDEAPESVTTTSTLEPEQSVRADTSSPMSEYASYEEQLRKRYFQ